MEVIKKRTSRITKYDPTKYEEESSRCAVFDFFKESRKCQTLYANFEGCYDRRVVNLNDRNTIENFVYCTMYFDGTNGFHNEQIMSKRVQVEKIVDSIIEISKLFHVEETHFGVVWVYYYSYEDVTQRATPVFKIYKSKTGNEAVFLDVSLTLYKSWDYYLETSSPKFPMSLLCVPRNGVYRFLSGDKSEKKGLDLEFVRSKKFTRNEFNALSAEGFRPFSQVAVRRLLTKMKNCSRRVLREIERLLSLVLRNKGKIIYSCYNVVVFGFLVWSAIKQRNCSLVEALKLIGNESLMLLNTGSSEDDSSKSHLTHSFLSRILTTSPELSGFHNVQETLTEVQRNGKLLLELLNNPKKNWPMILSTFCDLFMNGREILLAISYVHPLPPILEYLLLLLRFSSHIRDHFMSSLRTSNKDLEINTGQELESISSVSKLSTKQTENFQICFDETDKDVDVINNMTLEKVFSVLPVLEKISSNESQDQFLDLPTKPSSSTSDSTRFRFLFLGKKDSYGIFFMPNASLPDLTSIISQLIGRHFIFKPETCTRHRVVLTSGNVAGTLFFPQKFSAIGMFSLETIEEQTEIKLDLLESFPSVDFNQEQGVDRTSTQN